MKDEAKANHCQKCGKCESMCPQHISIRDDLVKVNKDLSN